MKKSGNPKKKEKRIELKQKSVQRFGCFGKCHG